LVYRLDPNYESTSAAVIKAGRESKETKISNESKISQIWSDRGSISKKKVESLQRLKHSAGSSNKASKTSLDNQMVAFFYVKYVS
jgi:hypothetical protein